MASAPLGLGAVCIDQRCTGEMCAAGAVAKAGEVLLGRGDWEKQA